MLKPAHIAPHRWQAELAAAGFTRQGAGPFRHNGTRFLPGQGWCVLESTEEIPNSDPLRGHLGRPGLWKLTRSGAGVRRVCELPEAALAGESDLLEGENTSPIRDALTWALTTEAGSIAAAWQPPPYEEAERWIPIGGLTVQKGMLLRQGELVHTPDRLALRFPILTSVPAELPEARRAWLEEILMEAQDRWRMVRVGLTADESAALAEVDLTGCPHTVLEGLFRTGLDALRWVVEWLVKSADFLADQGAASRAVEVCRARAQPAESEVVHG